MPDNSKIEWTEATWNPVTGCTKVSPGCDNCYAETIAERFRGTPNHPFTNGFDLTLRPERLDQPTRWRRPRRIFVNSMSDLFHKDIPDEYIAQVFGIMAATPRHTYQILTKRPQRMRSWLNRCGEWDGYITHNGKAPRGFNDGPESEHGIIVGYLPSTHTKHFGSRTKGGARSETETIGSWPLNNVWLGVSVETQQWADIRIPTLLETPAAVRWLSCEPLLGPINLDRWIGEDQVRPSVDWVVAGGESGRAARPMHPAWARGLRDQCTDAGVPFLFKQWGEFLPADVFDDPKMAGGRAYHNPKHGGRTAAIIREPGPSGTMRTATTRPLKPGDRIGAGVMLDHDTIAVNVGKKNAGRTLDGRTWDEYPDPAVTVNRSLSVIHPGSES